jgi:Sodium/calcium exchanger protein
LTDGRKLSEHELIFSATKPSTEHNLYDIQYNAKNKSFSCFMWQRSYFYSNARMATNGWHLRWFTINLDDGNMYSVPNRFNSQKYIMKYPAFTQIEIDMKRQIIRIIHPSESSSKGNKHTSASDKSFYLLATSSEVMAAMVDKLEQIMEINEKHLEMSTVSSPTEVDVLLDEFEGNSGEFECLIEYPADKSMVQKFLFIFLYPYLFLLHYTIPDVRQLDQYGKPTASIFSGTLATVMCLLWMVIGSYAMVSSLEGLAALMDIPDAIVGVTVSAAGTSLPNYVGSVIAAQKGFGVSKLRISCSSAHLISNDSF